jgi:uroporphyrinogen III methyltransferase/synthase
VIPLPTIETVASASIDQVDEAVKRAVEFDWLIFTSANGVRFFFERLQQTGTDVRIWHRARLAAIGPQTAREIERHCLRVDLVPEDYRAEGVIVALAAAGIAGKRVLLPRAAGARAVLPEQLRALGATVDEIVTYESVPARAGVAEVVEMIAAGNIDAITFTSSSTVHNFVASAGGDVAESAKRTAIGCIGPITAETARGYGMAVAIQPATYTVPAFAAALSQYFAGRARRRRDNDAA